MLICCFLMSLFAANDLVESIESMNAQDPCTRTLGLIAILLDNETGINRADCIIRIAMDWR